MSESDIGAMIVLGPFILVFWAVAAGVALRVVSSVAMALGFDHTREIGIARLHEGLHGSAVCLGQMRRDLAASEFDACATQGLKRYGPAFNIDGHGPSPCLIEFNDPAHEWCPRPK